MKHFAAYCRLSLWLLIVTMVITGILPVQAAPAPVLLKEGMTGDAVLKLQIALKEIGFYNGPADGNFGIGTLDAVMDFQFVYDLLPDGVAGPQTMIALREAGVQTSRAKPPTNRKGRELVLLAKQYIGTPYVWAGSQPGGFDCSGFIYYIYNQHGIDLPRMADEQYTVGRPVMRSQLLEGDLVYFSTYEPGPSHVGIYMGGNQFIHASSGADKVTVTSMDKPYYVERYIGARRVIK